MKQKIILTVFVIASSLAATAQNIPNLTPRPIQKPVPAIKSLKKLPDLQVTKLDIISAAVDEASGLTNIKISLKVTNSGTAAAAPSQVMLSVYTHSFEGYDHILWQTAADPFDIPALPAGASVTKFAIFTGNHLRAGNTYRSKIKINVGGVIEELTEANNETGEFSLTIH